MHMRYVTKSHFLAHFLLLILRLAPVLKHFFINVSYHKLVASLTLMALFLKQSHQSKTTYKYMIWHIGEICFKDWSQN